MHRGLFWKRRGAGLLRWLTMAGCMHRFYNIKHKGARTAQRPQLSSAQGGEEGDREGAEARNWAHTVGFLI